MATRLKRLDVFIRHSSPGHLSSVMTFNVSAADDDLKLLFCLSDSECVRRFVLYHKLPLGGHLTFLSNFK